MKTKYPVSAGSRVFYKVSNGKKRSQKSGYAIKMGLDQNGQVMFLVVKRKGDTEHTGISEWIKAEQLI